MEDLQDWDDAGALFSPSAPVSGTGTGFDSSLIKGVGEYGWCCIVVAPPFPSGLTSLRSRCASVCACSAKA